MDFGAGLPGGTQFALHSFSSGAWERGFFYRMGFMNRFFLLPFLFAALAGCNPAAGPPPIVIGHVSDKTRQDKAGDQAELGIRLALKQMDNEALAKVLGGRGIQVRHTDTRGVLDAFESQAVRLESVNRSFALLGGLSVQETAALHHAKVPLLTMHGQPVAGASNLVFYLGMPPIQQGAALAKAVADGSNLKRITILLDEKRLEAVAVAESFQKALTAARVAAKTTPVAVTTLRFGDDPSSPSRVPEDVRWREVIERLIGHEADTVLFAGSVQDFNAWHKMLRREFLDSNPHIVYAGADGSHRLFEIEASDKMPVTMATAFFADPASEKITAFMKAYKEAFQVEADVQAVLAYDGFRMLVEAVKRANAPLTPDRIREQLLNTKDFDGLTGPLTITADRHVQRSVYAVSWQNGTMKLVRPLAGQN